MQVVSSKHFLKLFLLFIQVNGFNLYASSWHTSHLTQANDKFRRCWEPRRWVCARWHVTCKTPVLAKVKSYRKRLYEKVRVRRTCVCYELQTQKLQRYLTKRPVCRCSSKKSNMWLQIHAFNFSLVNDHRHWIEPPLFSSTFLRQLELLFELVLMLKLFSIHVL